MLSTHSGDDDDSDGYCDYLPLTHRSSVDKELGSLGSTACDHSGPPTGSTCPGADDLSGPR